MGYHEWITLGSIAVVVGGGIFGAFYNVHNRITENREHTLDENKRLTEEIGEIKTNYLDRFKELNKTVTDGHIKILEKIEEINIKIASRQ